METVNGGSDGGNQLAERARAANSNGGDQRRRGTKHTSKTRAALDQIGAATLAAIATRRIDTDGLIALYGMTHVEAIALAEVVDTLVAFLENPDRITERLLLMRAVAAKRTTVEARRAWVVEQVEIASFGARSVRTPLAFISFISLWEPAFAEATKHLDIVAALFARLAAGKIGTCYFAAAISLMVGAFNTKARLDPSPADIEDEAKRFRTASRKKGTARKSGHSAKL